MNKRLLAKPNVDLTEFALFLDVVEIEDTVEPLEDEEVEVEVLVDALPVVLVAVDDEELVLLVVDDLVDVFASFDWNALVLEEPIAVIEAAL